MELWWLKIKEGLELLIMRARLEIISEMREGKEESSGFKVGDRKLGREFLVR